MEHLALYRKYRPRTFEDVCGQEHITSVLKYESEHGRLSHAYLFCGPRGTGKTTCAKILAKAVNCESTVNGDPCGECYRCRAIDDGEATDIVEMDAASNTSVEYIRDIRDEVAYTPAMMKKRVYIIDEVHMLSMGAFNALLKTLEEPPEHVVFVLATTEQHKIPATIISRCQRFDFRRITVDDISSRLRYIASKEGIALEDEASSILARQAQGGMRDAINLFELCASGGADVTTERVRSVLGITGLEGAYKCALAVKTCDFETIFSAVADVVRSSKDIAVFWGELISFWRDMLVAKTTKQAASYLDISEQDAALVYEAASRFTSAELVYQSNLLDEANSKMNRMPQMKRNIAELTLVKIASPELDSSTDAVLSRLSALESKIKLITQAPDSTPEANASAETASAVSAREAATPRKAQNTAPERHDVISPDTAVTASAAPKTSSRPDTTAASAHSEARTQNVAESAPGAPGAYIEISDKSELIERISEANPTLRSFFADTVCLVARDGMSARIVCTNPFAASVLSKPDSLMTIADALHLSGVADLACTVKVEQGAKKASAPSPIDELGL